MKRFVILTTTLLLASQARATDKVVCAAADNAPELVKKMNEIIGDKKASAPSIVVYQGYLGKLFSTTVTVMCVTLSE